jgi:hypothetical protein
MLFLKGSSKFAISYSNIRACIKQLGFLQKAVFPGGCVRGQITQNRPEIKKNVGKKIGGHDRLNGAATKRWILQQLNSKTVLAHISAFQNRCTLHPFHTTAT